jgi:hypothetical protein
MEFNKSNYFTVKTTLTSLSSIKDKLTLVYITGKSVLRMGKYTKPPPGYILMANILSASINVKRFNKLKLKPTEMEEATALLRGMTVNLVVVDKMIDLLNQFNDVGAIKDLDTSKTIFDNAVDFLESYCWRLS